MSNLVVIAHRGASGYAPEHTFAAWDLALAQGADYLEQDLQLTQDGVLVVMHDESIDRTARRAGRRCSGPVSRHTFSELRELEVGSWFNDEHPELARPDFDGQPVPTLDEVLGRYAERAAFYIETKQPELAPGMEETLLGLLRRHDLVEPARREWRVLVQSFSEASLRKLQRLEPGLPLIQLVEETEPGARTIERLEGIAEYAVGIGPSFGQTDAALIARAHEHCLAVHPWTVNDTEEQRRLVARGIDGIFTDFPDRLLASRPEGEPRGPAAGAAAALVRSRCLDGNRR